MIKRPADPEILLKLLEKNHATFAAETDDLRAILHLFFHEGRAHYGKNVRRLDQRIQSLEIHLNTLMAYEEEALFPFVGTHIPRFQPLIEHLLIEHRDFRKLLNRLTRSLAFFKNKKESARQLKSVQRIREDGMYLVCVMQSHIWTEAKKMYQALNQELRPIEKERLAKRLWGFL